MNFLIFWALTISSYITLSSGAVWSRADITLKDNGYEGILIAINKDVPENYTIIDNLKEAFTKASSTLFKATRQRIYFKKITILVPITWSKRPEYEKAGDETFERANIRIDNPNPIYGDAPYVQQTGGCGEPGEYVHFTPTYLLDKAATLYNWGPPEKSIIHEWGHLRWGLFDEYAKDRDNEPHFYVDGKKLLPVRCNDKVKGYPMNPNTNGKCQIDRKTLQVDKDCRYVPDQAKNTAKASLMYMQFMKTVEEFCDSGYFGDSDIIHDSKSPNSQNNFCDGASAWDIMRKHKDFQDGGAKNPLEITDFDKTPSFKLVQASMTRVCLVLDISGSMVNEIPKRLPFLRQAMRRYIISTVEEGSYVGIVTFNTEGIINLNLTQVADNATRYEMLQHVPSSASGGTSIGNGLCKGLEVLRTGQYGMQKGGNILLISDGKNSKGYPKIDEPCALPTALSQEVIVDTIAISNAADAGLEKVAKDTGGLNFFYDGTAGSTALIDAIDTIGSKDFVGKGEQSVTIATNVAEVHTTNKEKDDKFPIDKFLDGTASLTFDFDNAFNVTVTSPKGTVYGASDFNVDNDFKVMTLNIPGSVTLGEWKYKVSALDNLKSTVRVNIQGTPSKDEKGGILKVSSTVDVNEMNFTSNSMVKIFATVTQGYSPIVGASVIAYVNPPSGATIAVPLRDNGVGVDLAKDDGIYAGTMVACQFTGNNRYSIQVDVKNAGNATSILKVGSASGSMGIPGQYNPPTSGNVKEKTGDFKRTTSAGSLNVQGYTVAEAKKDTIPPAKITDLQVTVIDIENSLVTLTWTAVGDDESTGTAKLYNLRLSSNFAELQQSFDNAALITQSQVTSGDLTQPKASGQQQTMTINMKSFKSTSTSYYIAIQAVDDAGNAGKASNLVSVVLEMPDITILDERRSTVPSPTPSYLIPIVVAVSILIVVAIVIVIVVLTKYGHLKRIRPLPL